MLTNLQWYTKRALFLRQDAYNEAISNFKD